jgi:V8-like Glu-specific endopeptidase
MKKRLFLLLAFVSSITASAQVTTSFFEAKDGFKTYPKLKQLKAEPKSVVLKEMQKVNIRQLLEEDKEMELLDVPFRFGYGMDVSYATKDGDWSKADSNRIWSLRIISKGAYSLNFIFSELHLAPRAELYIYNPDGSVIYGPVTEEQDIKQKGQTFLTDLIAGDESIIQIIEPDTSTETSTLRISRVVHAYKNTFSSFNNTGLRAASLTCHNDVACYPAWDTQSNGVAVVLLSSGTSICSGSLLNNTAQNGIPYFLTAFHCIDANKDQSLSSAEKTAATNWAFKFKYKKTTCNGSTVATTTTYNNAYFRAAWNNTDFALMEIANVITDYSLSFLGWDRSSTASSSGTGIHHPGGDVMKISFDDNSLTSSMTYFWKVDYNNGTTEGGSSGSPLFNSNKLVIGQLLGGESGCAPVTKYYGRFDLSWTGGGTNDTRLKNWLDPLNMNPNAINTFVCMQPPAITYIGGPSDVPLTSNTATAYYSASPNLDSSYGDYNWEILPDDPSAASLTVNRNSLTVVFYQTGYYEIRCNMYNSCTAGAYLSKLVHVTTGTGNSSYSILNETSNQLIVKEKKMNLSARSADQRISYILYNQATGVPVAEGTLPSSGGILNFDGQLAGVYILQIETTSKELETHRVLLK